MDIPFLLGSRSNVFTDLTLFLSMSFPQTLQTAVVGVTDMHRPAAQPAWFEVRRVGHALLRDEIPAGTLTAN